MDTRPKVLSIDENSANQKLVEKILSDRYEVKAVLSGTCGTEELYQFQPDAILLDVNMPEVDGLRWCRMIRSEPAFADIPILFVSCVSNPESHQQGLQVRGDDGIEGSPGISVRKDIHVLKQKLSQTLDRTEERLQQPTTQEPGLDQNTQYLHEYLLALLSLDNQDRLGQLILDTLGKMGLKGAVYRHHDQHTDSSIGPLTDLEAILLQQANQTYPADHSARFLWGSKYLGAMIQNMPSPNDSQYQPLRQILVTLFKAADEKLQRLQETQTPAYKRQPTSSATACAPKPHLGVRGDLRHLHGYKLECALEILETQSEKNLSAVCQRLQRLTGESGLSQQERQTYQALLDQCVATRLAIYDQCLEIQAQYHQIMQCDHVPATAD